MKLQTGVLTTLAAAWLFLPGAGRCGEDGINETARGLVEKHKDAVVLVEVVVNVKLSQGGQTQEREHTLETNGTVISPDGLTVVSNGAIDPTGMYERFRVKADSTVTSARIVLADGTEHEAAVLKTDRDLDLAFLRPKEKVELPSLKLAAAGKLKLLDPLVAITRLDRKSFREPGVAVSRVLSVISKPRLSYLSDGQMFQGCPVFNGQGEVLGLALSRSGAQGFALVPCEDVLEAAAQVPKAGEEKKNLEAGGETETTPAEPPAGDEKDARPEAAPVL